MAPRVILVGVDGSAGGDRALEAAAELSTATNHDLVAVHVAHLPVVVAAAPAIGGEAFARSTDELADQCHVTCELALAAASVHWSFEVRYGEPVAELLHAAADHDAACLVVGRHGHRSLARLLLGSVTDR